MKFPRNFLKLSSNLPETFTFCNFYEFHSENSYIFRKYFINNYYILYKIYPYKCRQIWVSGADKNFFITFWCISWKRLAHSYQIPNLRICRKCFFFQESSFEIWQQCWHHCTSPSSTLSTYPCWNVTYVFVSGGGCSHKC